MPVEINKIYNQDCIDGLKNLPDNFVNCCVTSPPYFGLRDYGHEGQIGLEETPDLFVTKMVEVFTEVKRVLKNDGTLWLNLGDSYNGYKGNAISNTAGSKYAGFRDQPTRTGGYGLECKNLKPKDLFGIPWMVAKALQAPVYLGKIKNELDRVWLAAMIDGEGCFYIHRRKEGQHAGDGYYRKNDTYSCAIEVANTHKGIIDRCYEITGVGSIICQTKDRRQPIYRWTVRCDEAKKIAAEIYPYVFAKRQQCRIIYNLPSNGEKAVAAWEAMKQLHAGIQTDIDFPEPKINLYEDGFYLRQDLIWSKPNPMPESVTDRCTKAHEYIFLLSKSNKYYYDNKAIQELANYDGRKDKIMKGSEKYQNGYAPTTTNTQSIAIKGHERWKLNEEGEMIRNKRSVWTINTGGYSEAHFATFPEDLIVDCIKAGCPENGLVLDPFMGAGTTALVASKLNRNFIGFELNSDYIKIATKRLSDELGMFNKQIV